ncbi:uncharacterized protein Z519_06390 [Cladophialophora bantiana CBS 173.52]|uniref:BTB domain-containing protein n=1 Tax=Cladophialophora bantiana (strain ATCC 10958 / CBS 173.52 / CDC B-1940 / NIH 8579) TaxID=1442370 RepID=A0A0D2HH18_CLAB1|nr:uncharacterized protein Z519_06390 [Cladophialophora bantiana CBS 173.52]KIW92543.1 hypothetical protein Z519_06390 [Cladophialophora bantiana CBS 173.52]
MSIASLASKISPEPSDQKLIQQLRKLDLTVKPDNDDETARTIAHAINRLGFTANARQTPDGSLTTSKSRVSSKPGGDLGTVTPDPVQLSFDAAENSLDNETGDDSNPCNKVQDGRFCRFGCKPISIIVDDRKYFIHDGIFSLMFPREVLPEGNDTFWLTDIDQDLFEAAVEYHYKQDIDTLKGKLSREEHYSNDLGEFAKKYENWSLLGALWLIWEINPLDILSNLADIYSCADDIPGFRAYFRHCLRQELPKRLEKGSSSDVISELVSYLHDDEDATNDVTTVLHDLWVSSINAVESLEDELAARDGDNAECLSDENEDSGWRDAPNDGYWASHNGNYEQPNNWAASVVDEDVKSRSTSKIPTAYAAPSDPLPPGVEVPNAADSHLSASPIPRPVGNTMPLQFEWGHQTSRRLNTPAFFPEPAPAHVGNSGFDAAVSRTLAAVLSMPALAHRIYYWLSKQHTEMAWRGWQGIPEIATGIGCTDVEALVAINKLVGAGLVEETAENSSGMGRWIYRTTILSQKTGSSGED